MTVSSKNPEEDGYYNASPANPFVTLDDLGSVLTRGRREGDAFLNYLLAGDYFAGKGVWVNEDPGVRQIYEKFLCECPHLHSDSPFSPFFNRDQVKQPGENPVLVSRICDTRQSYQDSAKDHQAEIAFGSGQRRALFCGGPAPKIAALLLALNGGNKNIAISFLFDGPEQSNESGSASYEHINHANALNAEHDNTGLGILPHVIKRALFGEPSAKEVLDPDFKRVDLWPSAVRMRDISIYLHYEIHGVVQKIRKLLGIKNDHDKSRMASKRSARVLDYIEDRTGFKLRLQSKASRALFVTSSQSQHHASIRENIHLGKSLDLHPQKLSEHEITEFFSPSTLDNICSVDIFRENNCLTHGFDVRINQIASQLGMDFRAQLRIKEVFVDSSDGDGGQVKVVGVLLHNQKEKRDVFMPVDYLGLSLGASATYEYKPPSVSGADWRHRMLGSPVPHQAIATGFTGQILFEITDPEKFTELPHTGLKQTHFVEMGRIGNYLLVKLTSGGNIGLPTYSRSYPLSALASMLRVLTPDCGLEYLDTVCAWPCIRGVNGTNNGEIVRIADNMVVRFGEGGTGMSKMGSNAQIMLDMLGLDHGLNTEAFTEPSLYQHTVIDNRKKTRKWLGRHTLLR